MRRVFKVPHYAPLLPRRLPPSSSCCRPVANLFSGPVQGESPQSSAPQLDSLLESANTVLNNLHSPVKLASSHEVDDPRPAALDRILMEEAKIPTGRQVVQYLKEILSTPALRCENIDDYVVHQMRDTKDGGIMPYEIWLLPVEWRKYMYRTLTHLITYTVEKVIHEFAGWPLIPYFWEDTLRLRVNDVTGKYKLPIRNSTLQVDVAQLDKLVDLLFARNNMMRPSAMGERQLYVNVLVFVLNLMDDIIQTTEIHVMAHTIKLDVFQGNLDRVMQKMKAEDMKLKTSDSYSGMIDEVVKEILDDWDMNSPWVPDVIEQQIYKNVLEMIVVFMEEFMEWSRIKWPDNKEISLRRPVNSAEKPFTLTIRSIHDRLKRVEREIQDVTTLLATADARDPMDEPAPDDIARFGRTMTATEIVECSALNAYRCAADVTRYPDWMPYCTATETRGERDTLDSKGRVRFVAKVGFTVAPGSGEIGAVFGDAGLRDHITYNMCCTRPNRDDGFCEVIARMSGDSKLLNWLEYKWTFEPLAPTRTQVTLKTTLRSKTLIFLPMFDAIEKPVQKRFSAAFIDRMKHLQDESSPLRFQRANSINSPHLNLETLSSSGSEGDDTSDSSDGPPASGAVKADTGGDAQQAQAQKKPPRQAAQAPVAEKKKTVEDNKSTDKSPPKK